MKWFPPVLFILALCGAVYATLFWAISFWPVSVLHGTHEPASEVILRTVSHYLIYPDWMNVDERENGLTDWILAEMRTRFLLIWGSWILVVCILIVWARRQANQSAHATGLTRAELR